MKTFKFLLRLIAVFGLAMMFAVSGFGASNSPTVNLSCAPTSVTEGNSGTTNVTCTVSLSVSPNSKPIDVTIATSNSTATSGSDYVNLNTTYSFVDGTAVLTKDFNISVNGDTTYEASETFSVAIAVSAANPQNWTPGTLTRTITIINDDSVPSLSSANVSQNEGSSSGFSNMVFTATLSNPSATSASVVYATASGTGANGAAAGFDFTGQTGSLIFNPGETVKTISVPIYGDTNVEGNEVFALNFSLPVGLTMTTGSATGTILNDDFDVPLISIENQSMAEGNGSITNMDFNVTVTNMKTDTVMVSYATSDGTALSSSDYTATLGTLTFFPGTSSQTQIINVPIIGDTTAELNENFYVILSSPTGGATITDSNATGNIIDDDSGGSCSPYVGQLTINEYNFIPSVKDEFGNLIPGYGNFVELKVIGSTMRSEMQANSTFLNGWTLEIFNKANTPDVASGFKALPDHDPLCDFNLTDYLIYTFPSNAMTEGAATLVVKDNNDKIVDILYYGNNSVMYTPSTCDFVYDTNMTLVQTQNKDVFRIPDGTGDWTDFGSGANSGATRCTNPGGGFEGIHTIFDAFDYKTPVTSADIGNPITTKISNKPINLTAISTNSTHTTLADSIKVSSWLARKSGTDYYLVQPLEEIDFKHVSSVAMDSFTQTNVGKDHVIAFKYCDNNGSYNDWDTCWPQGITAQQRVGISWDNFAIRPNQFMSSIVNGDQVIAEKLTPIVFQANQYNNSIPSTDYNETEDTSFVADVNISNNAKVCAESSISFSPNIIFGDGSNVISGVTPSYTLPNVGDFNVTIHEIMGSEFALVDADDTSDTARLITPFAVQIKVIPDHFTMDGNLTNRSNGFTYLSNFEEYNTISSREMSGSLDSNITAKAFNNNTMSNYAENCYAKDGNLTTTITPFTVSPAGALTKMLWYEKNHDTNGSIVLPLASTVKFLLPRTSFDSNETNGTASVNYLINFDRNQTKLVNPFTVAVGNVDMNDSDSVTGTKALNTSVYYLYGRIIPRDVRVFGSTVPFSAKGWYEVFNASSIGATALPVSKNDALWHTNTLHSDVNDGDANVTVVITGANPANTTAINGIETYLFGATPLGSYKAHIDTAPWLWYGINALPYLDPVNSANLDCLTHPCFNISIVPPKGATGSAKTVDDSGKKENKATTKGGGLIYDYAPAIR